MATLQMDRALAEKMVENAILFCADHKFSGNGEQTIQALHNGRCDACEYLVYSLVRQIGGYLGQMDMTVKAVYVFRPDRSPLSPHASFSSGRQSSGINLIAWVDRKSPILAALGAALEKELNDARRRIGCVNATPACGNLDIYLVDDCDVQEGRGYGAIVQSMYVRSIQVWTRVEQQEPDIRLGVNYHLTEEALTTFNPELAPEEMLFEEALAIERMDPEARKSLEPRLEEEKVVLIRRIISDQLAYINIAKEWFSVSDLIQIRKNKIGYGKIGGKSAGLLLAARILDQVADEPLKAALRIPESYFLGSDLIYVFMSSNRLTHWNDQKYKSEEQMRVDFPQIQEEFQAGVFPPDILEKLHGILDQIGRTPLIVRSSSQLEDNFGTSFAGKYDSFFCPNQGTRQENLRDLTQAIARTYASTLKPDALLYRRSKGLQNYDERMAILIQVVQGERFGRYFLPQGAGVAFSRNLYRWSPQITREEGFARIVWGLGTRAVERVGNDFPRLVALGHPNLQPDDSSEAIRRYSQQYVDVIDLEENVLRTLPISQVLKSSYPPLRYLVVQEQEGYFTPVRSRVPETEIPQLAITFSEFLRRTPFAPRLGKILSILEDHYHNAVDLEFTFQIPDLFACKPEVIISLLQCRPQAHLETAKIIPLPVDLAREDLIFSTRFMVPQGYAPNIQYVVFVPPEAYYRLPADQDRQELGRIVAKLNTILPDKSFICVGPGRWGTTNPDLGVYVSYADIHKASALVELSGTGIGPAPEPSLGTHFFQDLMEAQIYPLAILLDHPDSNFNRAFFYETPNSLSKYLDCNPLLAGSLRLIEVDSYCPQAHIELVMDDEASLGIAYLVKSKGMGGPYSK